MNAAQEIMNERMRVSVGDMVRWRGMLALVVSAAPGKVYLRDLSGRMNADSRWVNRDHLVVGVVA